VRGCDHKLYPHVRDDHSLHSDLQQISNECIILFGILALHLHMQMSRLQSFSESRHHIYDKWLKYTSHGCVHTCKVNETLSSQEATSLPNWTESTDDDDWWRARSLHPKSKVDPL